MAQSEPQDWKEKYLQALEKFEDAEKQAERRLNILRKGFVRVSLAADGLGESLDDVLAELRVALRKNSDVLSMEPMIARLERCVIALDDTRKDEYDAASELIDGTLVTALEFDLSRKDKSSIKSFRKKLPGLLQGAAVNIDLWKGYLDAQRPVYSYLTALENDESSKSSGGWFQKIFSSGKNHDEVSGEQQDGLAAKESADLEVEKVDDRELSPVEVDIDSGRDSAEEELKSRTVQVFCGLVDKIETPDEFGERKSELVLQLQNDFDWQSMPDFLTETMELVASTRRLEQSEFEGFLVSLHDRLHDIQQFLTVAREGEEQAQLNQTKLDQEVRAGLKDIKISVDKALDIGILKEDITLMVNHIVDSIDVFHLEERSRRDEVYEKIEMLGEKMGAMESEAMELRNNLEAQRLQAMRDPLTELPNRQAYDEQSDKEFSRWKRHERPLSMAIVDIDFFKKINDSLGHLRGDKVLKLVAREIQKNIRSEDFVSRYGGEEFVVLMPDTGESAALAAMEKIRRAIENCPFNFAGERIAITASFGVSELQTGDTIVSCFDRADKAMYRAKENGRNCVELG